MHRDVHAEKSIHLKILEWTFMDIALTYGYLMDIFSING